MTALYRALMGALLSVCLSAQTAKFPDSVATDAHLKLAANRLQTVLRHSVGTGDTAWTVADASRITANMLLTVDSEIVSVTSVAGDVLTVVRGYDGTTAAPHNTNRSVAAFITAWHHNALAAEVKAIETALGPGLSNVPGSAGTINVSAYDFATLTPGVAITGGSVNNVLTITCPTGVSGTDTSHWLYFDDIAADTSRTITGAVTSSGLIKITAASHGFVSGNFIKIAGVVGVPANGGWTITYVDANSFTLNGSTFAGTYTSGGTAARGDEPVLITGGTCTSGAAGTLIVRAGNAHLSTVQLKSATDGMQEALNVGISGGVNLRFTNATLYAPVSFDGNAGAEYTAIVGRGRWASIATVDPGFPMTALGVFILKENAVGQTLKDLKISFTQPDSTDLNSYARYPVAVYGKNASRTEISGVLIERAWDCFDFRYNAGGSSFTDIWASAFGKGFRFDGSLDTIRIDGLHYWPFSLTANQATLFLENDNVLAMDVGRVDDLKVSNSLMISGKGMNVFTGVITAGDPVVTITNTAFDSRARIVQGAGEIRFVNSYMTMGGDAAHPSYTHTGGTFTAAGSWFFHVTPNTQPLFSLVADGTTNTFYPTRNAFGVSSSYFVQYGGTGAADVATMISANPSISTDLQLIGNRFQFIENISYANAKLSLAGSTNAIVTGNFVSGKGSGTGAFLSVASDTNNRVGSNVAAGWTITLPATLANGAYEVGNVKQGLDVKTPGAGGIGSVFSLYGADATKRKSFRINETTGALEILNSDFSLVVQRVNNDGTIGQTGVVFSALPTTNGTISYCSDCTVTSGSNNTCTSGGTGALAVRLAGASRCYKDQN